MVRNLLNCHKQTGDMVQARVVHLLLSTNTAPVSIPYPVEHPALAGNPSPAELMQMLQNMLQMP
jgi:hypothetical protein